MRSTGRNNSMMLADLRVPQIVEEQTYQAQLRAAAAGSVSEADVQEVVSGILGRAKKGDKVAIDQLFTHVLGANSKPTKVVNQVIVPDVKTGARLANRNGEARIGVE